MSRHWQFALFVLANVIVASNAGAQAVLRTSAAPDTGTVQVGSASIAFATAGMQGREQGQPVVVFESGAGTPLDRWGPVFAAVSVSAPAMAYDRPGIGASTWDSISPTPAHVTSVLRQMLERVGVPPPYILVGHSWGGVLVRYFATTHPEEVVGIVYIDPTEFMRPAEDVFPILRAIGAGVPNLDPPSQAAPNAAPAGPVTASQSARDVVFEFLNRDSWLRMRPEPPNVPTALIGRVVTPPGVDALRSEVGEERAAEYVSLFRDRLSEKLQEWLPSTSKSWLINAGEVGHFIHDEEPQIIVNAIEEVIRATEP